MSTKPWIVILSVFATFGFCGARGGTHGDVELVTQCISASKVSDGANYQVMLRNLYHLLYKRYDRMEISEFDSKAKRWGWQRVSELPGSAGFVSYLLAKGVYFPSREYSHDLQLKVFVGSDKLISGACPVLCSRPKVGYRSLLAMGYPRQSVVGRLINLKSFRSKAGRAARVESIELSYYRFQYTMSPLTAYIFCVDTELFNRERNTVDRVSYGVVSGLDYYSGSPASPESFRSSNTLVKPPFTDWKTLTEDDGAAVFHLFN